MAFLPFLLRLGIDTEIVKHQAVLELYREWRWSKQAAGLKPGSDLTFQRVDRLSSHEDFFEAQLQKDFVLKPRSGQAMVRAFFDQDSTLRGRIEVWDRDTSAWVSWEGESRLTNNGILFGPWVAIILILLGATFRFSIVFGLGVSLVWASKWNLLEVPSYLWNFIEVNTRELYKRISVSSWSLDDFSRIPEFSVFVWLVLSFLVLFFVRKKSKQSDLHRFILLSFFFEPIALALTAYFAEWPSDAAWWKVYLGSLCFRFFSLSILFMYFLDRRFVNRFKEIGQRKFSVTNYLALSAPIVFLMCKGWSWLNSVLLVGVGDSLLRMKIFVVGLLLGFVLGSRVYSIWLGALALSLMLPPTKGHWFAASLYGFFFDAVLLGWFMSPFKIFSPVFVQPLPPRQFAVLFLMTWVFGVFLTSVGVNLPITWLLLGLSVWAYIQLNQPRQHISDFSSASSSS